MKGKTILITGGTTGIGLATASLLSNEGAKVLVTGRNPRTLESARKALPGSAVVIQSDSASLEAAQAIGEEVKKHADHLDGLFLNAGIAHFVPLEAVTPKDYEDTFNVNVRGPFFQLQSLLPLLRNPSSVVFTSSVAASVGTATASIYSATKAAITSLGKTLASELAQRGIRVNVISPGPIATPIIKKAVPTAEQQQNFEDKVVAKTLFKRYGTSEEVAQLVRFLISEESSYITGAEMFIDGGVRWG